MRGELLPVWPEMKAHVWTRLERNASEHPDLYCELFRALNEFLVQPKSTPELLEIADSPMLARRLFRSLKPTALRSERAVLAFLEECNDVLEELGGHALANSYYNLLADFLMRFSLRYELRRPCKLCPSLPGIFSKLMADLRLAAQVDPHLSALLLDFEDAVRDLQGDRSEARLKTCIQKQMNLLEGLGRACPNVTGTQLGPICEQVGTWPHSTLKSALKNLYGFASDYPGIRHAGNPASVLRPIETRDLIGITIALVGFTTYLTPNFDAERVYWEGETA